MNVEHLVNKNTMQVKTVVVYPNGRVETHQWFDDITKSLVVNLSQKKWKAAANIIFKHPCLQKELFDQLKRSVSAEFKDYCSEASESMLKQSNSTDLESFSNKLFVCEVRLSCPLWMSCLLGACNASSDHKTVKEINAIALSTAAAARCRNQKMSAIAYRISAILFKN